MRAGRPRAALAAGFLALLAPMALVRADLRPAPAAGAAPVKVTCTFQNRSYVGACVEPTTREGNVTPAAACRPILDCLNDARCVKTYCQSTSIRQGWRLKSAQ